MNFPTFDELLDRVYFFDSETYKHDTLFVFISRKTKEEFVFHNANPNDYQEFIDKHQPILVGYNSKHFDKYILKACLLGYSPEEVREISDYIVEGNNPWEYNFEGYCSLPPVWDLMDDIVPRKSLKEIEGHLCEDITETTIDFYTDKRWSESDYREVLHYCRCDVTILLKLFDLRYDYFQAKYTICKMKHINPEYSIGFTNAKLTSVFLDAVYHEYDDCDDYEYPENFELEKIPNEIKNYFDKFIHKELDIHNEKLSLIIDGMRGNVQEGGIHFALDNYIFERDDFKASDYYE